MKKAALPIREIIRITEDLARYWRDHHLMDQLTVTRGYAELTQMDPTNTSYVEKLHLALESLSAMAGQRGLRTTTERIRNMGIEDRSASELGLTPRAGNISHNSEHEISAAM